MTWSEVIRKLKRAGFVDVRTGKGSHLHLHNPRTGQKALVSAHATQDAGRLGNKILRDAGGEVMTRYPIVFETEESGAISAYVAGLPIYAAANTRTEAEQAIRSMLVDYLETYPDEAPIATVRVAQVRHVANRHDVRIVGPAALVGSVRTPKKARASRANGRLGGRPRKAAVK